MRRSIFLVILLTGCGFGSMTQVPADTDTDGSSSSGSPGDPTLPSVDDTAAPADSSSSNSDGGSDGSSVGGGSSSSSDGAADTTDTGGASTGESSTGDALCEDNLDCGDEEVCASAACVDAWAVPHSVRVLSFDEPCDGAGTNMFFVEVGGLTSENVGCPRAWPADWFNVAGGASVAFDFFELGGAPNPDQFIARWCWDDGMGCSPIPKADLHLGTATVMWADWEATFDFEVVD